MNPKGINMNKPITAIIVGAGHRSLIYARYALTHPDRLKIVGIADPDAERRKMGQKLFSLPDSMLFEDAAALAVRNKALAAPDRRLIPCRRSVH